MRVSGLTDVVDVCGGGGDGSSVRSYYLSALRRHTGDTSTNSSFSPAFSVALVKNGTLFSFGSNFFGELGRGGGEGSGDEDEWRPQAVEGLEGERVVGVACGLAHSAAWTENGSLFMWGRGGNRQLGQGDREDRWRASRVNESGLEGEKVVGAALGLYHTLVWCLSGRLFVWESNWLGQLENGRDGEIGEGEEEMETLPIELIIGGESERVVGAAAGAGHSIVLTSSQRVFSFGWRGSLLLGDGAGRNTPKLLDALPPNVAEVAAGGLHFFLRMDDGSMYSFGWGQDAMFECPPREIRFEASQGVSFWISSRPAFTRFFPPPFSSLKNTETSRGPRIETVFSPSVELRLFDVAEPVKIRVRLTDSAVEENTATCEFKVVILGQLCAFLPLNTFAWCSPVSKWRSAIRRPRTPPGDLPPHSPSTHRAEMPIVPLNESLISKRDNVDVPADVGLSFHVPTDVEVQQHFSTEETLNVLVEATDLTNNTGNCTIVITADRCPRNSDRATADSPCLCNEDHYRSSSGEGFVCLRCDQNSRSNRGSTSSADCLCQEGFYADPSFSNASICQKCILNSSSRIGAVHPSQCVCVEGTYFVPPPTRTSEGKLALRLRDIITHNDALALFTSGTCEPCRPNAICSGELLTDSDVSQVLKNSGLLKFVSNRKAEGRELESLSSPSCGTVTKSQTLSPLRILGAQFHQTLAKLIAHPRPVPHGNFSLVQRWPSAVVVPCPFDNTCSGVDPRSEDLPGDPLCNECDKDLLLLRRGIDTRCHPCPPTRLRILAAIGLFLLLVTVVLGYTVMVTKENPKMDVPEHAVAIKILIVFFVALGFLADLARPALNVFREDLLRLGLRGGGEGWESSTAQFLAKAAEDSLDFLRSIPTVGELFSMKCFFDLFDFTTGRNVAGRQGVALSACPSSHVRLRTPSCSSLHAAATRFKQVRECFRMRLAYNRRFLGIFRHRFDSKTSFWARLLSLLRDVTPVFLATLFLWASSLVAAPLASLRCEPVHHSLTELRLHAFPSITCNPSNPAYSRWWGVSLGILFGGVFGVPLLVGLSMLLDSSPLLLAGFRDDFLFWEVVIFARRLSIPLCFLALGTSARYNILIFHAVFFLVLQTILRPYRSDALNWLETFSLGVWFFDVMVLKQDGHALVPVRLLSSSERTRRKRKREMQPHTFKRRANKEGTLKKIPTGQPLFSSHFSETLPRVSVTIREQDHASLSELLLTLHPADRRDFERCLRFIDRELEVVNMRLKLEREHRQLEPTSESTSGDRWIGQRKDPLRSSPSDLCLLPFILSFCVRLALLCDASMNHGRAKQKRDKRFIAHTCETNAEHCAIVRELLGIPHPGVPSATTSDDSATGHDHHAEPRDLPLVRTQPVSEASVGHPAGCPQGTVRDSEGKGGRTEQAVPPTVGARPPSLHAEVVAEASKSGPDAEAIEGRGTGGECDSDGSLSLEGLALSDHPSLLDYAESRMCKADVPSARPHAPDAATRVPSSATVENAKEKELRTSGSASLEPLRASLAESHLSGPQQSQADVESHSHCQEGATSRLPPARERDGTQSARASLNDAEETHSISATFLRKRRSQTVQNQPEAEAEAQERIGRREAFCDTASVVLVGNSREWLGRDEEESAHLHRGHEEPLGMQWTEDDAETADGILRDRLIFFCSKGSVEWFLDWL
uniref:HYR domain-containing protein n=1 Tax=Chromera velia CCMP2878 TaxID=1169474 RepID=A0A0G4ICE9_9ALVE|eukprot:Cvel_13011.t1-p1 / transcript=Cvel_13011.t1 / gene=Cvel_13011 / organism=Chromera_velia_CCMP2878 / gene_product=Ultraviolet-B receptor UVR8, putative / transcript_product=Ultraviolet-B receptor UVR8, putative / location=Cvel_scaffold873:22309-30163(-) / protein_length=1672 / sequence_SO=supercontig / SO=protein_coding / is_pseudo=false